MSVLLHPWPFFTPPARPQDDIFIFWLPQEDALGALGAVGVSLHVEEVEAQVLGSPSVGGSGSAADTPQG